MELINRKHFGVAHRNRGKVKITFHQTQIYFSLAAVAEFNLKAGLYIHFLTEGKVWGFIQNADPDGFKFTSEGSKKGWLINSRGLIAFFQKQTGYKSLPCSFYLAKSEKVYDGKDVIEIMMDKSIEQLIAEQ